MTPELRREILADHARRLVGRREQPSPGAWAEGGLRSPTCGDEVTVRIRVSAGTVDAVEWHGMGCEVSQASASMLASGIRGARVADLPALVARVEGLVHGGVDDDADDLGDVAALADIGRYPVRGTCATLAWRALLLSVR